MVRKPRWLSHELRAWDLELERQGVTVEAWLESRQTRLSLSPWYHDAAPADEHRLQSVPHCSRPRATRLKPRDRIGADGGAPPR